MSNQFDPVCAWCDVYCREEQITVDENDREVCRSTVCSYCGRSELRFGKLGRQTPIPADEPATVVPLDPDDDRFRL